MDGIYLLINVAQAYGLAMIEEPALKAVLCHDMCHINTNHFFTVIILNYLFYKIFIHITLMSRIVTPVTMKQLLEYRISTS